MASALIASSARNPRAQKFAKMDIQLALGRIAFSDVEVAANKFVHPRLDEYIELPESTASEEQASASPVEKFPESNPDIAEVMMAEIEHFNHAAPSSRSGIPPGYADYIPHLHSRKFIRIVAEEELTD